MGSDEKTLQFIMKRQIELHFANFIYILLGMVIFVIMYFMSDCMYTKEVGILILGWIGVLISSKKHNSDK